MEIYDELINEYELTVQFSLGFKLRIVDRWVREANVDRRIGFILEIQSPACKGWHEVWRRSETSMFPHAIQGVAEYIMKTGKYDFFKHPSHKTHCCE